MFGFVDSQLRHWSAYFWISNFAIGRNVWFCRFPALPLVGMCGFTGPPALPLDGGLGLLYWISSSAIGWNVWFSGFPALPLVGSEKEPEQALLLPLSQ